MGRTTPSHGLPPASQRKEARAKDARALVNKTIPALLSSNTRARKGVDAAELIVNPPPLPTSSSNAAATSPSSTTPAPKLRLIVAETLTAAFQLSQQHEWKSAKSKSNAKPVRNVAVLNMASPLRPGGGLLNGATSHEEALCLRTTLYASLREEFYRLPEVGVVFTPDVMVFRDGEGAELGRGERWWVDVVSGGMLRFPDLEGVAVGAEGEVEGEGGFGDEGGRYADGKDREVVERKMRAVLRVLCAKKVERVVLGAWGCGAYGNPIGEIARAWRRVLLGDPQPVKQKGKKKNHSSGAGATESWEQLKEVVFAIKERKTAVTFARCFGGSLQVEETQRDKRVKVDDEDGEESTDKYAEMQKKVQELEAQMQQVKNKDLKARLGDVLLGLKKQLVEQKDGISEEDEESEGEGEIHREEVIMQEVDEEKMLEEGIVEQECVENSSLDLDGEDDEEKDKDEDSSDDDEENHVEADSGSRSDSPDVFDNESITGSEVDSNTETKPTLVTTKNGGGIKAAKHSKVKGTEMGKDDKFFDDEFFRDSVTEKRSKDGVRQPWEIRERK